MFNKIIVTPVGLIELTANKDCLLSCQMVNAFTTVKENDFLQTAANELIEYFSGLRKEFSVKTIADGTEFQLEVWNYLKTIPYAVTKSYKEQATEMNKSSSVRAVASANGKNQLLIFVPCHRIISSNGSLGGYRGGIEVKRKLLELETYFNK